MERMFKLDASRRFDEASFWCSVSLCSFYKVPYICQKKGQIKKLHTQLFKTDEQAIRTLNLDQEEKKMKRDAQCSKYLISKSIHLCIHGKQILCGLRVHWTLLILQCLIKSNTKSQIQAIVVTTKNVHHIYSRLNSVQINFSSEQTKFSPSKENTVQFPVFHSILTSQATSFQLPYLVHELNALKKHSSWFDVKSFSIF